MSNGIPIDFVALLPANLLGVHILSLLSLGDLFRFECAVPTEWCETLPTAYRYTTIGIDPTIRGACQRNTWEWCVKRDVYVRGLRFGDETEELEPKLLKQILNRVQRDMPVEWSHMVDHENFRNTEEIYDVIGGEGVVDRISRLSLRSVTNRYDAQILQAVRKMKRLSDITTIGTGICEQFLSDVLLACPPLVSLSTCQPRTLLPALPIQGKSLVSLRLREGPVSFELLLRIGQHCCNLQRLLIQVSHDANVEDTEVGLACIAAGCPPLCSIQCQYPHNLGTRILGTFAQRCPELATLSFAVGCATLTDDALLALHRGCPKLKAVDHVVWDVTSFHILTVTRPLLERLSVFGARCRSTLNPVMLGTLLLHLQRVVSLHLSGLTAAHAYAFAPAATYHYRSLTLICAEGETVPLDDFVRTVATRSPNLDTIVIKGSATITKATMTVLAAHCPLLSDVDVDLHQKTISEGILIDLVRHWRHLESFKIGSNRSITLKVILAILQGCRGYSSLDLRDAKKITEKALTSLMTKHPRAINLYPPATLDAAALERVKKASFRHGLERCWLVMA